MASLFKPVERGPQHGAPPSLEFVALDRLQVDPAYQRAVDGPLSRRIITAMVKAWQWPLCQPLVVARRADGSLYVLDGQHRLAGARERGDILHLPCVVLPSLRSDEEARAFVDLNTRRQKLGQTDLFNGLLAAGDENAKATAAMIARTGWRIVRSSATTSWKPGDLVCAPMIADQRRIHGEAVISCALSTLRRAYPTTVVTAPANLIRALVQLFRADGKVVPADAGRVVEAMAQVPPHKWLAMAEQRRARDRSLTLVSALAEAIATQLWADAAPPVVVSPTPAQAPQQAVPRMAAPPSRFDEDGRAWCDQCDRRVSLAEAVGCRSRFCKLPGSAET